MLALINLIPAIVDAARDPDTLIKSAIDIFGSDVGGDKSVYTSIDTSLNNIETDLASFGTLLEVLPFSDTPEGIMGMKYKVGFDTNEISFIKELRAPIATPKDIIDSICGYVVYPKWNELPTSDRISCEK